MGRYCFSHIGHNQLIVYAHVVGIFAMCWRIVVYNLGELCHLYVPLCAHIVFQIRMLKYSMIFDSIVQRWETRGKLSQKDSQWETKQEKRETDAGNWGKELEFGRRLNTFRFAILKSQKQTTFFYCFTSFESNSRWSHKAWFWSVNDSYYKNAPWYTQTLCSTQFA